MLLPCLAALLLAAAPAPPVKEAWDRTAPKVEGAWVRSNPVPGRPSAGYLTITGGGAPDKLVGVTSPGLRIELHSMTMDGGVMKMAKLDSLPVPAGAKVALASGGNHLMIFGLTGTPKTLPLTLLFGSGAKVATTAEVRSAAAAADPHAGHGQH
jgi:copper(I)-binding protein